MEELHEKPSKKCTFIKLMKRDGKDVEGGNWIKGRNGRMGFSQKDRCIIWKEHMERIMNEENAWDHKMDAAVIEGPVEKVSHKKVREAIRKMKQGKAAGLSEITLELIVGRWQNCRGSDPSVLPTSFGWKGNPKLMENQHCDANF